MATFTCQHCGILFDKAHEFNEHVTFHSENSSGAPPTLAVFENCEQIYHTASSVRDFANSELLSIEHDKFGNALSAYECGTPSSIYNRPETNLVCCYQITKVDDKVGVYLKNYLNGIFITYIRANSPAAEKGLRITDQVINVDFNVLTGKTAEAAMKIVTECPRTLYVIIRMRPFARTISLTKENDHTFGFKFKRGKIEEVNDGSAAKATGLLKNSHILEINGICVLGLTDECLSEIFLKSDRIDLTVIASCFYKKLFEGGFSKKDIMEMDRSAQHRQK